MSQPALISTSDGRQASPTRRLVFAIAQPSKEAIRATERVDVVVKLRVRQGAVHVAHAFRVGTGDVIGREQYLESPLAPELAG